MIHLRPAGRRGRRASQAPLQGLRPWKKHACCMHLLQAARTGSNTPTPQGAGGLYTLRESRRPRLGASVFGSGVDVDNRNAFEAGGSSMAGRSKPECTMPGRSKAECWVPGCSEPAYPVPGCPSRCPDARSQDIRCPDIDLMTVFRIWVPGHGGCIEDPGSRTSILMT